jgi:hypothetical protein
LRSLGILIEERSGGGEQQDEAVAWLRSHRLFGLRCDRNPDVRFGSAKAALRI